MKSRNTLSLKGALKSAIVEAIEENSDLVQSVLEEAIESADLKRPIKDGKKTPRASREAIFATLANSLQIFSVN